MIVDAQPRQGKKIIETLASWGFAIDDDVILMSHFTLNEKDPMPIAVRGKETVDLSRNERTAAVKLVKAKMAHEAKRKDGEEKET